MRDFLRAGFVVVCLVLVLVQGVAAWNVTQLTMDSSKLVTRGTPVNVTGTIDFAPASGPDTTFDPSHELVLSTTLSDARWDLTLVVGGAENVQPAVHNNTTTLSGFILSYPKGTDESLKIRLTGKAPGTGVPCTSAGRTILLIQEYDARHSPVPGTSRALDTIILYDGSCINQSNEKRARLSDFRFYIDEKSALGTNTTLAEVKYAEADALIKSATGRSSTQYMLAHQDLDAAQKAIDEGEVALDKAWAEKAVADAQVPINNTDAIIGWFKANSSTADDPQLPAIVAKREVAMSYLVTANDEIANGNYDLARLKAQEAYNKANESYTNGNSRNDRTEGSDHVFPLYITGCIIVTILLVIGIVWWRKQKGAKLE
jgi:hypothetical protein